MRSAAPVRTAFLCVLCTICVLCAGREAAAQIGRPKADVTAVTERPVRAGDKARLALKVSLPEGLHSRLLRVRGVGASL